MTIKPSETQPQVKVIVDLSAIPADEFDAQRALRVATVRHGKVVDHKDVIPAGEKDPRRLQVQLSLGVPEDGVAGADVVVAPADDQRNVLSKLTARRFVSTPTRLVDAGDLRVSPSIYRWWRFCWFPRHYRVSGRVVRHEGECTHPVGAAQVEIYDVDYCWWWYDQDLLRTVTTDADGFFDTTFTWCVPLWCLFEIVRPPIYVDPFLRDRFRDLLANHVAVRIPPFPPPPDPWEWERRLEQLGFELPVNRRPQPHAALRSSTAPTALVPRVASVATAASAKLSIADVFGGLVFWPRCDDPCDWLPDIKIRVTQSQPDGTVVIYEDGLADIRWNQAGDLLNLALEANASALYADDCRPDVLLGNCVLFERVGDYNVSTIYQPDIAAGVSYGATPDRRERLGHTVDRDRAWCLTIPVHGDFGLAAGVDYYQVQVATWTHADVLAWDADHTHRPPEGAFAAVDTLALGDFARKYAERVGFFYVWRNEGFAATTIAGIHGLYKSRQRFEQDYRDSHGGLNPAPDFSNGWYWDTAAMTRVFNLDTSRFSNGLYSFRLVGYRQTGVDASGSPILAAVNMGLPGGVGRRCGGLAIPELLTLWLYDDPHVPTCKILDFKKNGVTTIDECAIVVLDTTDSITIEYKAEDLGGNLNSYLVTLQRGFDPEADIRGLGGVGITGSAPQGPDYSTALADAITPAIPPVWTGGTWTATIPAAAFAGLGGSCAYNLRLRARDRQTNGSSSILSGAECQENRAFTVILAADRAGYCNQLGCSNT